MPTLLAATHKNGPGNTPNIDTTGADLLIAICSCWVATPGISDSAGNTWTPLTKQSINNYDGQLFYVLSPTTSATHNFGNSGGSFPGLVVAAFSGVAAYEKESGTAANGVSTIAPGSLTPDTDGALVITGLGFEPTSVSSIDSGFTIADTSPNTGGVGASLAYLVQGTAAAVNPTWTLAGNANLPVTMAVFEAAPDPPTPARVSQTVTETIGQALAGARVTQSLAEYAGVTYTPARVTQDIAEVVRRAFTPTRITQNIVEIIRVAAPFAPSEGCPTDLPIGTASDVQCPVALPIGVAGSGACAPTWDP